MPKTGTKGATSDENGASNAETELTSFDEVAAKLASDFDNRFGRIESAIDALVAVVPKTAPQQQGEKRPFVPNYEPHQTRSKAQRTDSQTPMSTRPFNFTNPNAETFGQPMSYGASNSLDAMTPSQHPQFTSPEGTAAIFPSSVNNNIAAWVTDRAQMLAPSSSAQPLPLANRDMTPNASLDSQISQILANTAHQLSTGNHSSGVFPFKYVRRAIDKPRPTANSLTMQEHLWGITRIIRDDSVSQDIKPYLYIHLEEILDDARHYDWQSAVRPWSEECFSLVAENRMAWSDKAQIQLLRMSMSRTSTARITSMKDQPRNRQNFYQQNNEQAKGGPPCPSFNSAQGCALQSGHMVSGRKMIHVCAYCLTNTSALNHHSEVNCRNKVRHANYHF